MRSFVAALLCLALAIAAAAQQCVKVPPLFLPGLFPESAGGIPVELATDPTGGVTATPPRSASRCTRWAAGPWPCTSFF